MVIEQFSIHLVSLNPTVGSEISKTRPCVVISPNELNRHVRTVIIAPMTTAQKRYPTRVACRFRGKPGEIVLDQIRTVDRSRLVKYLGTLAPAPAAVVRKVLLAMFD